MLISHSFGKQSRESSAWEERISLLPIYPYLYSSTSMKSFHLSTCHLSIINIYSRFSYFPPSPSLVVAQSTMDFGWPYYGH